MPLDLRNELLTFQRALDMIFSGVRYKLLLFYIDKVIFFSRNQDEHLENLETVLNLLEDAEIKINMKSASS